MNRRIIQLQKAMAAEKLDGFLVTDLLNVRYLTGYTGSNGSVLVTRKGAWFYTDFRYKEQIKTEVKGCHKRVLARNLYAGLPPEDLKGVARLGVEQDHMTLGQFRLLKKQMKHARLIPAQNLVQQLRRTKEPVEVEMIARAQDFTDRTFRDILPMLKPGTSERDIAFEIESRFRRRGEVAFDSIIASGPNGAKPHAGAGDRKLRKGDAVTLDIGCRIGGYCSDMTRTVFIGRAPAEMRKVYEIVLEAQCRGLEAVRPGTKATSVDAAARDHIAKHGYGKQFGHSLGHGVGLAVHERPVLAGPSRDTLEPGDVVTVEPGIYIPGKGGVRIEDMVLVTDTGLRNFTHSPKELLEL